MAAATSSIQLYNSTPEEGLAGTDVIVKTWTASAVWSRPATRCGYAQAKASPFPTASITSSGAAANAWFVGEVSLANDYNVDNRFYEPVGRLPEIEEDEPPLYLLCKDYARFYHPAH